MKKEVGMVTPQERDEIRRIFERRNGLMELAKIVTSDGDGSLYERLIADLGDTSTRFQQWWDTMGVKYDWEGSVAGQWEIDFNQCKVYLVIND